MKVLLSFVIVALFAIPVAFSQEPLIGSVSIAGVSIDIAGYTQLTFIENADPEFDWPYFRTWQTVKFDDDWKLVMEENFAHMNREEINWLRKFYLERGLNENWKIRFGRVVTSAFFSSIPPFKMETISCPLTEPFRSYGYGIQFVGAFENGWSLLTDITTSSGYSFDNSKSFEYPETSARLTKKFGDNFSLSENIQISEEYQNFGMDGTWKINNESYLRVALYRSSNDLRGDSFGGYLFGAYYPAKWLELHSRLDLGAREGKSSDLIWANGIRLFSFKKNLSLTADVETPLAGDRDCRFLARLQFMF
ncbi:MAG: hypothetical protein WC435_01315 [Candidatus Paceibacterota bacterium]